MAPLATKRQLNARHGAQRVSKRQRLEKAKKPASKVPTLAEPAPPKTFKLDELPWNEVAMPDRLEDVKGFFGLEEIEGVEVIQTGNGSTVEYRVWSRRLLVRD
jgi:ATP-dependent RNA helicase DDX24/MAK5